MSETLPVPTAANTVTSVAPDDLVPVLDTHTGQFVYVRADAALPGTLIMTVPPQPTGLAASAITQTGMNLTWTMLPGVSYALAISPAGQNQWGTPSLGATAPFPISGLSPETAYDVQLTPSDEAGAGTPEVLAGVMTLPAQPTGAAVTAITQTGFTVTLPTDPNVTYEVDVSPAGQNAWTKIGSGLTGQAVVTGLASGSYDTQVIPSDASGAGPAQLIPDTTLLPSVRPPTLTVGTITDTTVELHLTYSPDSPTTYLQQSGVVNGQPSGWGTLASGTSVPTDYTASGLAAGTTYDFQALAWKAGVGYSAPALVTVTTTGQAAGGSGGSGSGSGGGSPPPPPPVLPPGAPAAVQPIPTLPAGAVSFRTAANQDTVDMPAGAVYSVFHAFAEGVIPAASIAQISVGGTVVPVQQADNRIAWPDGSLRSAIFSWAHPAAIASAAQDTITFAPVAGAWNNTAAITWAAIRAHAYQVNVSIGGTVYSLALAAANTRQVRSGPALSAWKFWGELANGATPQGQAWCKGFVYAFADGRIRLVPEVYCGRIANQAALAIDSITLTDGATTLLSMGAFTLYGANKQRVVDQDGLPYDSGPRTDKVIWRLPQHTPGHPETTWLYDAKIAHFHKWTETYIENFPAPTAIAYAPTAGLTLYSGGVDGEGLHTWLGHLNSNQVMALLTGRDDYLRQDRLFALGLHAMARYWVGDPVTGEAPVLNNNTYPGLPAPTPNVGWGLAPTLSLTGGINSGTTLDNSHAPNGSWFQYLATGHEEWLEDMIEQAVGVIGGNVVGTAYYQRNPTLNGKKYYGVVAGYPSARAIAWEMRNLSNAAWALPDGHPMKPYMTDLLNDNYAAIGDFITTAARATALGVDTADSWQALGIYDTGSTGEKFSIQSITWTDGVASVTLTVDHGWTGDTVDITLASFVPATWDTSRVKSTITGPNSLEVPMPTQPVAYTTLGYVQLASAESPWMHFYGAQGAALDQARGVLTAAHPLIDHHQRWTLGQYGDAANPRGYWASNAYRTSVRAGPNATLDAPYARTWTDTCVWGEPPDLKQSIADPAQPTVGFGRGVPAYPGHNYPNLARCAAQAMLAEGIGGDSAAYVTSYTDANMTFDEATWGSMGGAQAWRIDIPPVA